MPSFCNTARWRELINALMENRGANEPTQALDDFFPTLDLLTSRPDLVGQRGDLLATGTFSVGAVAAQFSRLWLVNPAGSNALVVATRVICAPGAATDTLGVVVNNPTVQAPPIAVGSMTYRDSRSLGLAGRATVAYVTGDTAAALQNSQGFRVNSATTGLDATIEIVLQPGWACYVQKNTANLALTGAWEWYERRGVDPSELANF